MDNEDHEPINMTDILSQASDLDAISARKLIYNEITKIIKRSPIMKKKLSAAKESQTITVLFALSVTMKLRSSI